MKVASSRFVTMTLRWVVAVRVLLPSSLFSICSVVVKVGSETVWQGRRRDSTEDYEGTYL